MMKMKLLSIASYLSNFFKKGKGQNKDKPIEKSDSGLDNFKKRFMYEGFGFWLDPFDTFRKSSVTRAGP
jgi:hypothetical protein